MLAFFASCSDVDLETANFSEAISNLKADYQDGKRDVTLSWTNPTMEGQSGIQLIQDDKDITNIDEVINSYYIQKAPTNVDVSYTVKARYSDGRVSEGQTVRFKIAYEAKKGGNMIAMLVPDDYSASDDEKDAVAWFKANYVDKGKGTLLTASQVNDLDIEKHAAK